MTNEKPISVTVSIYVPVDLLQWMRQYAKDNDTTVSRIVVELLEVFKAEEENDAM